MPPAEKKGNRVANGGFEQGLTSWLGVDNVGLVTGGRQHEGLIAAAMGKEDNTRPAKMFQDVLASPCRSYRLQFSVAGRKAHPADLEVDVRYLDSVGADLGTALGCSPLVIPAQTIGPARAEAYKTVITITEAAPNGTAAARLFFTKLPGERGNYLLIDSVSFRSM